MPPWLPWRLSEASSLPSRTPVTSSWPPSVPTAPARCSSSVARLRWDFPGTFRWGWTPGVHRVEPHGDVVGCRDLLGKVRKTDHLSGIYSLGTSGKSWNLFKLNGLFSRIIWTTMDYILNHQRLNVVNPMPSTCSPATTAQKTVPQLGFHRFHRALNPVKGEGILNINQMSLCLTSLNPGIIGLFCPVVIIASSSTCAFLYPDVWRTEDMTRE